MKNVSREAVVYSMDASNGPRITVHTGERLRIQTEDCFSHQVVSESDVLGKEFNYDLVNPATGPISVEGCGPGDALKITIHRIELDDQGVIVAYPGWGPLGKEVKQSVTRVVRIADGLAQFADLKLALRPMVGVIGVAPAEGSFACGVPGSHGGNLDTLLITEGATLFLPVFVPGALLSLGDVHALMGDGEVCGTGVEIRAQVEIGVEVLKGRKLANPVVRKDGYYYFLSSHESLDQASDAAVREVVQLLAEKRGLSWIEAYMLASVATDLQVSQIVNPLKTVRVRVPAELIEPF